MRLTFLSEDWVVPGPVYGWDRLQDSAATAGERLAQQLLQIQHLPSPPRRLSKKVLRQLFKKKRSGLTFKTLLRHLGLCPSCGRIFIPHMLSRHGCSRVSRSITPKATRFSQLGSGSASGTSASLLGTDAKVKPPRELIDLTGTTPSPPPPTRRRGRKVIVCPAEAGCSSLKGKEKMSK